MSEICKLHLVISAAFTALQNLQIAPKTFDNDKCLVKCAYILRDLRFLFAHKPHISLEQFAAGILSLNKVVSTWEKICEITGVVLLCDRCLTIYSFGWQMLVVVGQYQYHYTEKQMNC